MEFHSLSSFQLTSGIDQFQRFNVRLIDLVPARESATDLTHWRTLTS